ncbi:MAG: acyl-CoA dehydrogenase family protein, partial [Candidatus Binatia bacterium]
MELSLNHDEAAFQREVRAWIRRNLPRRERKTKPSEFGDPKRIRELKAWQRKLHEAGYLAMGWPREYGGQTAPDEDHARLLMRQTIVNEELVRARAPSIIGMMGIQMLGPTLMQFGSEPQKRQYLPKILSAEEIW